MGGRATVALVALVLCATLAAGAQDDDYDDYGLTSLMKKVSGHKNHHHHVGHQDHFWHYLALLTIKAKVVFVAVLVALGAWVFFYYGHPKCSCPALPPPPHHYPHDFPDRKGRSLEQEVRLAARVADGIGSSYTENQASDAGNGSCKRRLLCELKQLNASQPALSYATRLFRLETRNIGLHDFAKDEVKRCDLLYPDCVW
ncbi:uncharacterized protein LOC134529896 [Bacillus rossius redtenbacheri]|uniref:uncharacterized protein LOC134529896 n=1 Tax=Bacillus rossius redtenbacheri TaxID=93214 RepID=UPI002FDC89FB